MGLNVFLGKAKKTFSVSVAALLLVVSATSSASKITSLHVFGDSLSDTGAFSVLSPTNCPPVPYFDCRFSNGPVWIEVLAEELGLPVATAYSGGTNYAIGGQRTDQVLSFQVPTFASFNGGVADPSGLYVVWAGANDLFQTDPNDVVYTPFEAAENILNSILNLSSMGAVDFLVPNLPILDAWAFTFNAILANGLDSLDASGLNITQFDAFDTLLEISLNGSEYGFDNVTDGCIFTVGCDPDKFLLWDTVHPTAAAHKLIAAAALEALSVSEPAIIAVFGLGFAGLVMVRRKRVA